MRKIVPEHLGRQAIVYVRQSTQDQLLHNHESRRRQYGLADRARQLGWAEPVVIDDDLGRSGGGVARPGFERLLLAICEGRPGIMMGHRAGGGGLAAGTQRARSAHAARVLGQGSGPGFWASVLGQRSGGWSAACSLMRTGSTTRFWRTIGCCSA